MNTPYFIINKSILDNLIIEMNSAFQNNWNNYIIAYSFKTNSNLWLIKYLMKKGLYAEVVSDDEYDLSQIIGYNSNVVYNGIIKSKKTFFNAIRNDCIVNIDTWREINWLKELPKNKRYKVGIRVNFDIENILPNESSAGKEGSRFGFCFENKELLRAINHIKNYKNIDVVGLHLHVSSKTRSVSIYKEIAKMANSIVDKYKLNIEYIDIGGGFFGGVKGKPTFEEYVKKITNILKERYDFYKTKIIIEPGMSLIGASMCCVTSVIDIKKMPHNTYIVTDGSRMLIDPLMRKKSYSYEIKRKKSNKSKVKKQSIVGYTCMEDDRIFEIKNQEKINIGDSIIYNKVGAYTLCLTPQFIKFIPDIYVKTKNKRLKLVEKHWEAKDLIRKAK